MGFKHFCGQKYFFNLQDFVKPRRRPFEQNLFLFFIAPFPAAHAVQSTHSFTYGSISPAQSRTVRTCIAIASTADHPRLVRALAAFFEIETVLFCPESANTSFEQDLSGDSEAETESKFKAWQLQEPTKAVYFGSKVDTGEDFKHFLFLHSFRDYISTTLAMILPKGSEFSRIFNHEIRRLDQAGMLDKLAHRRFDADSPGDATERIFHKEAQALGYKNFSFPTIVMLCGIIAGLAISIFECKSKSVNGC